MYFPDLNIYQYDCYLGVGNRIPIPSVRTIGWLQRGYEYTRGKVDSTTIEKLRRLLKTKGCSVTYKGFHYCDWCDPESVAMSSRGNGHSVDERRTQSCQVLWIPANDGYFATPSLIVHYILDHGYCPPVEFVEAVHAFEPDSDWNAVAVRQALCEQARADYRKNHLDTNS